MTSLPDAAASKAGGRRGEVERLELPSLDSRDAHSPTSRSQWCSLNEPNHEISERLTRQQAAELLTDVAYALITDGRFALDDDRDVRLPTTDEVLLKRESTSDDDRVQLELTLSWSIAQAEP